MNDSPYRKMNNLGMNEMIAESPKVPSHKDTRFNVPGPKIDKVISQEDADATIRLLVDDRVYRLKKGLLLNSDSPYFKRLAAPDWPIKEGNIVVIDQQVHHFPIIMSHLEGQNLDDFLDITIRQIDQLMQDAERLGLVGLRNQIKDVILKLKLVP